MCGISGKVYSSPEREVPLELVQKMTRQLIHRGPDDEGFYCQQQVGLGMRRLSIIDLECGQQPISNEDETVWVVFNGEIYNYQTLREGLIERGHQFKTNSDTEVIVHLYEEKGEECLNALRGMFAIALWDSKSQKLFLARDRVGKKPLCYTVVDGALIFGSEIKSILADPSVTREVDLEGMDLYFSFQFIPAPQTLFKGIFKLPPGHYLTWEKGEVTVSSYWEATNEKQQILSIEEAKAQLGSLLTESIKYRLVSDVPVGAFLSGGLDSTVIVGLMSQFMSEPVRTFSIGFTEGAFNELPFARQAAETFGTEHKDFIVTPNVLENIAKLVWHFDEPFADKSSIPTFFLCEQASKDVKVALCGDGGDEAFAGYGKYAATQQSYIAQKISEWMEYRWGKSFLKSLWNGEGGAIGHAMRRKLMKSFFPSGPSIFYTSFFDGRLKRTLYKEEIRQKMGKAGLQQVLALWENTRSKTPSVIDQMLLFDFNWYLPGDLLVKTDIASMAHGIELRSPFLDHKLLEFAFSLPSTLKVSNGETKILLKKYASELVPREIIDRKKKGFSVPLKDWFRGELREWMKETLLRPNPAMDQFFHKKTVEQLVQSHLSGRKSHTFRLWSLILFYLWHQRFIEGKEEL